MSSGTTTLSLPTLVAPSTAAVLPRLDGVSDSELAAAFESCREVVRLRARNFYYGLRLTPEPRRSAVYAIYAWMRFGDDRVDETRATADKHTELAAFREKTESVLSGMIVRDQPFWLAFAATVRAYRLDHSHIRAMLDGLGEDIEHTGYETIEDLEAYCYRVASTVGLVCVGIWGYRQGVTLPDVRKATELAVRRGLAFQLTNILRDFAEDFDQVPSRVYLPRSVLARHGLGADDLRAWRDDARCRGLVLEIAQRASEHYRASLPLDETIDPGCRSTLYAMTRIYAGLLDLIQQDPRRIVGAKRIRLSSATKALIAGSAFVRGTLNMWPPTSVRSEKGRA